ncbi:MAG: copper resistance protein CopC, partial [Chloroflexi bacterium]|nr:copper resistance protein CopC [Chloroflexota bacterium]
DSAPVSTDAISRGTARRHRLGSLHVSGRGISVAAGLLLALVIAAPTLAHADLVESSPKDGAVLETPPTKVTLTFSEALDAGKSSFKLLGPDGTVGTGRVTVANAKVMALDELTLATGAYEVRWTAASPDGHLIRGTLAFTVAEPTPTPATPAAPATPVPTADPTPGPATPEPPAPETAAPTPADDAAPAAAPTIEVLIPIAAGLIIVVGIGVLVLRRSRRA